MTREVTDNLYIDLEYFTPEEYYTYEAQAEAALTSQAAFVCVADTGAVKDFSAALSVTVSQATQETRVRTFEAPLGTAFDTVMVIDALRITDVTLVINTAVSAVPEVNRATAVTLSNIVTLNAQAIKSVETSAQLTGTVTQTTLGNRVNRVLGDPIVYTGDVFSNLAITAADKKWGTGSLKFDAYSSSLSPYSATYLNGTYYAVHDSYTWSSTDGINWTRANSDLGISFPNVQTLNNRLVVFSSNTIKTSTDGQTWTSYTGPGTIGAITYNNNLWIIAISVTSPSLGHITYTSPDLTTWTQRDSLLSNYSSYSIKDLKTSGTTTFLLITYTVSAGGTYSAIRKSSNGTTWSGISAVTADLYNLANDGAGNWVISVNNNYTYYTATNTSTNLTARTSTKYIGNLFYNSSNSTWYNFSSEGQAYTSANTYPTFTWSLAADVTKFPTKQQSDVMYGYSSGLFYSTTDAVNYQYEILGQQENLKPWIEYQEDTRYSSWKTIDFWYLASSNTGRQFYISNSNLQSRGWLLTIGANSGSHNYFLTNYTANNSAITCSGTVSNQLANTWHHVRIAYDNGIATIFVNGSRITGTNASERNIGALRTLNSPLTINNIQYIFSQSSSATDIYIDELLITDELLTAPTATSYTVPTGAYTNTDQTDILLHFDGSFADDATAPPKTVNAVVPITATFAQQVSAIKTAEGFSALTAQATQTAQANYTVDSGIVDIPFDFYQTANVTRIKQFDSSLTAFATQLTAAARVGEFLASANAEFTQSTTAVAVLDSTIVDIPFDFFLDASVDRTRSTAVSLAVEFTQTVDAVKTTTNTVQQSAEFAQAASIDRTRDNAAQAQAAFTQITDATAIIDSDIVDIPFDFFQDVEGSAVRSTSASFDTVASQITIVGKTGEGITDLDTAFALNATAEVTSGSVTVAQAAFTQTVTAVRIKALAAQLTTTALLSAEAETVSVFTTTQTSEFTQSTDIARTRGFDLGLDTVATQSTVAEKITANTVTMTTAFAQSVDGDLVTDSIILGPTSFNQNTQAVKTAQGQTAQTSQFTLTAQGDVGNIGEAQLNSTFTMTVEAAKTAQFIVFEPVVISVSASGTVTRQGSVSANSESMLAVVPGKILQGSAALTAFYSQLTVGSEQSTGTVSMTAEFAMTTVGKIINIDPDLTYMIRRERRDYQIPEEIREDMVIPELRTTIIRRA